MSSEASILGTGSGSGEKRAPLGPRDLKERAFADLAKFPLIRYFEERQVLLDPVSGQRKCLLCYLLKKEKLTARKRLC